MANTGRSYRVSNNIATLVILTVVANKYVLANTDDLVNTDHLGRVLMFWRLLISWLIAHRSRHSRSFAGEC